MKKDMNWKVRGLTLFFVLMLSFICAFPQSVSAQEAVQTEQTQQTKKPGTAEEETVPAQQATIRIRKKSASLEKGDTLKLRAKIKNSSTKKIIWKSSRKSVASVNKNGRVKAKKKGRTVITARISGTNIKAKCVIRVKNYITMRMRTTGYCNCRSCAGIWAGARTASGTRPKEKRTIAVDKRLISLGTKVGIGSEMYVAEDTGGAIKGKRIDVYYASHRKAMAHGVKYQNVRVYY